MKREELYRAKYKSEREFKQAVSDYITFYNEKRPHKYLNYKTPTQFEKESIQIGKFSSKRSAFNWLSVHFLPFFVIVVQFEWVGYSTKNGLNSEKMQQ